VHGNKKGTGAIYSKGSPQGLWRPLRLLQHVNLTTGNSPGRICCHPAGFIHSLSARQVHRQHDGTGTHTKAPLALKGGDAALWAPAQRHKWGEVAQRKI
jgi:hypothetical protein